MPLDPKQQFQRGFSGATGSTGVSNALSNVLQNLRNYFGGQPTQQLTAEDQDRQAKLKALQQLYPTQ